MGSAEVDGVWTEDIFETNPFPKVLCDFSRSHICGQESQVGHTVSPCYLETLTFCPLLYLILDKELEFSTTWPSIDLSFDTKFVNWFSLN